MTVSLNDTTAYHRGDRASLGWEQTISECLKDQASPYMEALKVKRSYGDIVGDLLEGRGMIGAGFRVLEVGGGYGNLARSLLGRFGSITMTMVDVSHVFLAAQRKTLLPFEGRVGFVHADVFDYLTDSEEPDLIISNEGMGDFPSIVDIPKDALIDFAEGHTPPIDSERDGGRYLGEARDFVNRLGIDLAGAPELINLNTGAVRFVEQAMKKTKCLFVTEHSSDWTIPDSMEGFFRDARADLWPRKILLFGHVEVTICFEHIARSLSGMGCALEGGRLMELLSVRDDPEIRYILLSGSIESQRNELIGEFVDHVKEYQWLVAHR